MEETKCCESEVEKNVLGYMQENDRLIYEVKMLAQEINTNILGKPIKEENSESILCMFDIVKQQNKNLREIANMLLEIKNAITAR